MRLALAGLLCAMIMLAAQELPEPVLRSSEPPKYPVLARQARIQGIVKLEFSLNELGETVNIQVVSGHPLLAPAAVEAVKTWRFAVPAGTFQPDRKYDTTFEFVLDSVPQQLRDHVDQTTVETQSYHQVRVKIPMLGDERATKCPPTETVTPPTKEQPRDFIELSRSGCYGTCPAYTVRVFRDGEVAWNGDSFVKITGAHRSQLDRIQADQLLRQFQSKQFWSLCGFYSRSVTDSAGMTLTVEIDGEKKSVGDYASSGPAWLQELARTVDDIADTHQWRHGDPKVETLSNISMDAWYGKPGLTPLMRAAHGRDSVQIRKLLQSGADVSAEDSSGWTALMYAAASDAAVSDDELVSLLLEAHADPNHQSPQGDTPLMAYALTGQFSKDLVKAGARINHQNKAGMSALMILATHADPEEIADALAAGADASLRDTHRRTALDYLKAANCGRSPLSDGLGEFLTTTGSRRCDALDKDNVKKSTELLRKAMHPR